MEKDTHEKTLEIREERIRKIIGLYYSRPEIKKVIFEFSKDREVVPRYFEGFGKRPDSLQYTNDVFELAKKGATSFHCSEELWSNPLSLSTEMNQKQLNELRIGWDLLIDIDSKYIDYSKIAAELIIKILKFHGVKNIGLKFSGSKGFHIIIPWRAFPKSIGELKTSDMFPEWPRILIQYINAQIKEKLIESISDLDRKNKYIKDYTVQEKVMPDLILVSPRHLFRAPYSLHEKTALASVVLTPAEIKSFQPKDANPLKAEIRDFMPEAKEDEARELLIQALDWHKENLGFQETKEKNRKINFKPIKIKDFSDRLFPPSIKKILQGVKDGRKRSLFILINFFRSIGMEKEELEKKIYDWNNKNEYALKEGYIKSQLSWSYRNKVVLPPNYDKDHYKGIGIIPTDEELRYKNPVSYMAKKSLQNMPEKPKK